MNLNDISEICLKNAEKRQANGASIRIDTRSMLKHCATEVVEATEAYNNYCIADWYSDSPDKRVNFINLTASEAKKNFSSELADIICCVLIIAARENIDIEEAIFDCVEKNRKRANKEGDKL